MKPDKFYRSAGILINQIRKLLEVQKEELRKKGLPPQRVFDLKRGLVYKNGIYIPRNAIEHRILLDGYEILFLEAFTDLFNTIFKDKKRLISQFSLRTLLEMGFPRSQIIFSKELKKSEIEKYKLVIMLADYGSLAKDHPEHWKTFNKLLEENAALLSSKQKELFENFKEAIKEKNNKSHFILTKQGRMMINSIQNELFNKTPILSIFNPDNIYALLSGISHILHGNIILLKDILKPNRPTQLRLRVYWVLLLTGMNVINHINNYLDNPEINKEVEKLNKKFEKTALIVKIYWQQL